jgi:hypothetical protein
MFSRVSFGSPVYIICVLMGALRFFFNKLLLTYKKKIDFVGNRTENTINRTDTHP